MQISTHLVDWVVSVEVWPETLSITRVIPSAVTLFSAIIDNGNTLYVRMYICTQMQRETQEVSQHSELMSSLSNN